MDRYERAIAMAEESDGELRRLRRCFHKYPETGWLEMRTSSIIAGYLEECGCDEILVGEDVCLKEARMGLPEEAILERHYAEAKEQEGTNLKYLPYTKGGFTGVIGILHCGEGPVTAFRFDIDALPITESGEDSHYPAQHGFASMNYGSMHACGHDGHTAVGLGTARILCKMREELCGTIKFIFQPAEEGVRGARAIVEHGHLDDVDEVYGAHMSGFPDTEGLRIGVGEGHSLATMKLDAVFRGQASHAAMSPEKGNNAMLAAATAILNLHAIPRHGQGETRVNVGKLVAGTGRNIICDCAKLELEVRGMTEEANQYMYEYAKRILEHAALMHGCTFEWKLVGAAKNGENNPEAMEFVKQVCAEKMGLLTVSLQEGSGGGSEDYSYMSERVQSHGGTSCYFRNFSRCAGSFHSETFDFSEEALVNGVKAFCGIALTKNGKQ